MATKKTRKCPGLGIYSYLNYGAYTARVKRNAAFRTFKGMCKGYHLSIIKGIQNERSTLTPAKNGV